MKKILQQEEKVLRQTAHAVRVADIKTTKIKKVLKEMSEALASQTDGVAIAAPQIGYLWQIFIVSERIRNLSQADGLKVSASRARGDSDPERKNPALKDLVFINPKISKLSHEKKWLPEGCLSVRPLYGQTFRSTKATITAYDENGRKFTRGASGLLAQIFQHETDHLNGILFIDHAKEIKAETPDK